MLWKQIKENWFCNSFSFKWISFLKSFKRPIGKYFKHWCNQNYKDKGFYVYRYFAHLFDCIK